MENIKLFKNLKEYEIDKLLGYLQAETRVFKTNDIILNKGNKLKNIIVVLVGEVSVYIKNFDGRENKIFTAQAGETVAANYICAGLKTSSIIIKAQKQTGILFLPFERMLMLHESVSDWQRQLLKNLFEHIAEENLKLNFRMSMLDKRSIREKILFYLNYLAEETKNNKIEIPFSREEMANYLCVDRCALSRELSNMCHDGILDYKKNEFILK